MYKKIFGTVVIAVSLAVSSVSFAFDKGCGQGMKNMLEAIKLDDSQKQKVKPILENLKSSMEQSRSQLQDLSKQINDQATSGNMDQSAVNGLIDQKVKLIGDMMKAKVSAKSQIFALLNPQQKTEMQNMMKKKHDEMVAKFKSCHEQDQE